MEATHPPQLITVTLTALLLGVSRSTIWRMINEGTLPAVRVRNRSVRVPADAIERLVRTGAIKAAQESDRPTANE